MILFSVWRGDKSVLRTPYIQIAKLKCTELKKEGYIHARIEEIEKVGNNYFGHGKYIKR